MLEYALRSLRNMKRLNRLPLGVVFFTDEGRDCQDSEDMLRKVLSRAGKVLVLNAGNPGDCVVTARRGQRRYRVTVEGKSLKLGQGGTAKEVMRVLYEKLEALTALSDRKKRLAVSAVNLKTDAFPQRLPHRVRVTLLVSYPDEEKARVLERAMRAIFRGGGVSWDLTLIADRPPMSESRCNQHLLDNLKEIAKEWDIPLTTESSLWPSVAGLVPDRIPVICGVGPVAQDLYTSREAVSRISLVQRTLLLSQYLFKQTEG
jgi:D-alanine-D-alanine ligase